MAAKAIFYLGIAFSCALLIMLLQMLPTILDIMISPAALIAAVVVGRMSHRWF